jgi:predicted DCC family thiol-disulfide oxidoreductase YuxK
VTTTLVYDGDCAFCTSSVRVMKKLRLTADVVVPWQRADLPSLGLTAQQCQTSVQLVQPGRTTSGAKAFAHLLLAAAPWWKPIGALLLLPPFSWLAAVLYRLIADNRTRLPGGTPACAVPPAEQP